MAHSHTEIRGDVAREAIQALGGYAYQLYLSAIAWCRLEDDEILLLEVAEDFAKVARGQLDAVQAKRTSSSLTLNSKGAIQAIDSLIAMQLDNPEHDVRLVYHTTGSAGLERLRVDQIQGVGGIDYWKDVQAGADAAPLIERVMSLGISDRSKQYIRSLAPAAFVEKVVQKLIWATGQQSSDDVRRELDDVFIQVGAGRNVHAEDCKTAAKIAVASVLEKSTISRAERRLTAVDLRKLFDAAGSTRISNQNFRNTVSDVAGFPTELVDREAQKLLDELIHFRFFEEFDARKRASELFQQIENGQLRFATSALRAKSFAWIARVLSAHVGELEFAQEALKLSIGLGECIEGKIAAALLGERDTAVKELLALNDPRARSAAVIRIRNEEGVEPAFTWFSAACDGWGDVCDGAIVSLLAGFLSDHNWEQAFQICEAFAVDPEKANPSLLKLYSICLVARQAPEEIRGHLLEGVPFNASTFKLSDHPDDIEARTQAIEMLDVVRAKTENAGLRETSVDADVWVLWLKLKTPSLHGLAIKELEGRLNNPAQSLSVVNLAMRFGLDVDFGRATEEVNRHIALNRGKHTPQSAVASLSILLHSENDAGLIADRLAERQSEFAKCFQDTFLKVMRLEYLCRAQRFTEAHALLDQEPNLNPSDETEMKRLVSEASAADPITPKIQQYEKSGTLGDLELLISALAVNRDAPRLVPYLTDLYQKTGAIDDAKRLIQALDDSGQQAKADEFVLKEAGLVDNSFEIASRRALAFFRAGEFLKSKVEAERLRREHDVAELRAIYVNSILSLGNWPELIAYVVSELSNKSSRSSPELISAADLVASSDLELSKALVRAAVEQSSDDPQVLADAYHLATTSGWEDEEDVGEWLKNAIKLSGENGPMRTASLDELVDQIPQWDDRTADIWKRVREAILPLSIAAPALRRDLTGLTLTMARANRDTVDPRKRAMVPTFHGKRRIPLSEGVTKIVLDLSSVLLLADLELLEIVIKNFEQVWVPNETLRVLFNEKKKAAFHQPSQLERASEIVKFISTDKLIKHKVANDPPAWLVEEVGRDTARLINEANVALSEGKGRAFVIHFGELKRAGSLGKEPANLRSLSGLVASPSDLIEFLKRKKLLTRATSERANAELRLRGDKQTTSADLQTGASLYLDAVALEILVDLKMINPLREAGYSLLISVDHLESVVDLLRYQDRAANIENTIDDIRKILVEAIQSGNVITGPVAPEVSPADEELTVVSCLRCLPHVDAMVCDDRAVNANAQASLDDISKPLVSTLELLDLLRTKKLLSDSHYQDARFRLRRSNYVFVPLQAQELENALFSTELNEDGNLIETPEMRCIRESIQTVKMTDWLTLPAEADWAQSVMSAIRETVSQVWASTDCVKTATTKSAWLVDLCEFRDWIRFQQTGGQSSDQLVAVQVFQFTTPPHELSNEMKNAYFEWVEEALIDPLRLNHPSAFDALIEISVNSFNSAFKETQLAQ